MKFSDKEHLCEEAIIAGVSKTFWSNAHLGLLLLQMISRAMYRKTAKFSAPSSSLILHSSSRNEISST